MPYFVCCVSPDRSNRGGERRDGGVGPQTLKKAYVLSVVHAQTVIFPHFTNSVNRPYELLSVTAIFM